MPMFKIYVGNLDPRVKLEQVRELFSPFATIEDAVLVVDTETAKPKGFAIIMIRDAEIGRAAVKATQGKRLLGKTLTINEVMKKGKAAAKSAKEQRQGPFGPHFNRQGGPRAGAPLRSGGPRRGLNRGPRGPGFGPPHGPSHGSSSGPHGGSASGASGPTSGPRFGQPGSSPSYGTSSMRPSDGAGSSDRRAQQPSQQPPHPVRGDDSQSRRTDEAQSNEGSSTNARARKRGEGESLA